MSNLQLPPPQVHSGRAFLRSRLTIGLFGLALLCDGCFLEMSSIPSLSKAINSIMRVTFFKTVFVFAFQFQSIM
eukprot:m.3373 g.3373  ORF g.3373 m.3373 type:complete len:74 (+) comp5173_c0_seq1:988-1209(+)